MLFPTAIIFFKKIKIIVAAAGIARYDTGGFISIASPSLVVLALSAYKAAGVLRQNVWGGKRFKVKQNIPLFTS